MKKICKGCGEEKVIEEFGKNGLQPRCKACVNKKAREWRAKNKEKANSRAREWRAKNKEKVRDAVKKYHQANPEKKKACDRRYREKNREKIKIKDKKYRSENKEYLTAVSREWRKRNREKSREIVAKWQSKNAAQMRKIRKEYSDKFFHTPKGRLCKCWKNYIKASLKAGSKAGRKWESLVGYTIEELMSHLENLFLPGMTWENHGSYWHIDHIIPKASFNYNFPEDRDFKLCWSLQNLQPLEAIENIRKGSKVDEIFKQSLTLSI